MGKFLKVGTFLRCLFEFLHPTILTLISVNYVQDVLSPLCSFPEHCFWAACSVVQDSWLLVGLAYSGKLSCVLPGSQSALFSGNANSFAMASGFVVFSTTAHEAHFAPVGMLVQYLKSLKETEEFALPLENRTSPAQLSSDTWEKRRVERGSRIVTVVPSTMSLVLQMPRGNLETINPRPLVMEVVKSDLDSYVHRSFFHNAVY
jgi:elongator complex protein 1